MLDELRTRQGELPVDCYQDRFYNFESLNDYILVTPNGIPDEDEEHYFEFKVPLSELNKLSKTKLRFLESALKSLDRLDERRIFMKAVRCKKELEIIQQMRGKYQMKLAAFKAK